MKKYFLVIVLVFITLSLFSQERQFNRAYKKNTVKGFDRFIEKYPISGYLEEVYFRRAKLINTISEFDLFINRYPKGIFLDSAQIEINRLIKIYPRIIIDYPKSIYGGNSPYSNVSKPFFDYQVTFKVTGGYVGYKLSIYLVYYDRDGQAWGSGRDEGEFVVKPGGQYIFKSWFSGKRFIGGYIKMMLRGYDDNGNPIEKSIFFIDCK